MLKRAATAAFWWLIVGFIWDGVWTLMGHHDSLIVSLVTSSTTMMTSLIFGGLVVGIWLVITVILWGMLALNRWLTHQDYNVKK